MKMSHPFPWRLSRLFAENLFQPRFVSLIYISLLSLFSVMPGHADLVCPRVIAASRLRCEPAVLETNITAYAVLQETLQREATPSTLQARITPTDRQQLADLWTNLVDCVGIYNCSDSITFPGGQTLSPQLRVSQSLGLGWEIADSVGFERDGTRCRLSNLTTGPEVSSNQVSAVLRGTAIRSTPGAIDWMIPEDSIQCGPAPECNRSSTGTRSLLFSRERVFIHDFREITDSESAALNEYILRQVRNPEDRERLLAEPIRDRDSTSAGRSIDLPGSSTTSPMIAPLSEERARLSWSNGATIDIDFEGHIVDSNFLDPSVWRSCASESAGIVHNYRLFEGRPTRVDIPTCGPTVRLRSDTPRGIARIRSSWTRE
jgi:hypothetical protein